MLIKEFICAHKGKRIFKKIATPTTLVVVFPNENACTKYGVYYAEAFAKLQGYERIAFVSTNPVVGKAMRAVVRQHPAAFVQLNQEEMQRLMRFLLLHTTFMGYTIYDNVKIIDPQSVYGASGRMLAEHEVLSADFFTWHRLFSKQYIFIKEVDIAPLRYNGEDSELQDFFKE